jgi:hypothetical protein
MDTASHTEESAMRLRRRHLLGAGLAAAATGAAGIRPDSLHPPRATYGADAGRRSYLLPRLRLLHADLHNHSHLSDGARDPGDFHTAQRAAGIDVAALTDHTAAAFDRRDVCLPISHEDGAPNPCRSVFGMGEAGWQRCQLLAEGADRRSGYVALAGFEWSSPHLGHVNVWFGQDWVDALATGGITAEGLTRVGWPVEMLELDLRLLARRVATDQEIAAVVDKIREQNPVGMRRFYDWLASPPGEGPLGGGADALAGFNHPNREPGAFDGFRFDPRVANRMVTLEVFNRDEDYLFKHLAQGLPAPLVGCLNAGWRVGLIGASDEHGTSWGPRDGIGRAGLWVAGSHRRGVRDALLARHVFATRETGLRLAATADGAPMGGFLRRRRRAIAFEVDIDLGSARAGMPVAVQVLRPDSTVPTVTDVIAARAAHPRAAPIRFRVPLDPDQGEWVLLRIADPSRANDSPAPFPHPCNDYALAYTSPWWFAADPARSTVGPPAVVG